MSATEGKANRFVDGVGWVMGIPGKLLLWDKRVNNHKVSGETSQAVADYLDANQLEDVHVRINEYAPGGEWRRLCENRAVGAGWRYTLGSLGLVGYTLLPGRIFGGDRYNPYTNSVYLYSDIPSLGIEAAAYAKDIHARKFPGTYAAVNELPFVGIWHETIATNDAVAYLKATSNRDEQVAGTRVLYPNYGVHVGRSVDGLVGCWPLFQVGGALAGHVTGWREARRIPADADPVNAEVTPVDRDEGTDAASRLSAN
ncbi:MAG: hypothetical protein U1D30_07235 [Planctomycetota bacterium]